MGADLIVYIAVGPKHLDIHESKKKEAIENAKAISEFASRWAAAEDVNDQEMDSFNPDTALAEMKSRGLYVDDAAWSELDDVRDLIGMDAEAFVEKFIFWWNDDKVNSRDVSWREMPDDPNTNIVVAGEMTWGESPSGDGWQMLNRAGNLGLLHHFGIC